MYQLGIDAGGTKLKCVVYEKGVAVDEVITEGINPNSFSEEQIKSNLTQMSEKLQKNGFNIKDCAGIGIGLAGISNPKAKDLITFLLVEIGYESMIEILGDHETFLRGATGNKKYGVALISGTGSICIAMDRNGRMYRTGGYGHIIDDEGSAYSVGRDILSAVIQSYDGRIGHTVLTDKVFDYLNISSIDQLIGFVYNSKTTKKDIAAISKILLEEDTLKDEIAKSILDKAAKELFILISNCIKNINISQAMPLFLQGGFILNNVEVCKRLEKLICDNNLPLVITKPLHDASWGAYSILLDKKKEILGQCFCVGFEGTSLPEDFKNFIREYKIGNIILFKRNLESKNQIKALCDEIQSIVFEETGLPAFIMIDQEGGTVVRLPEDDLNVPGAMAIAATSKLENARRAGNITARNLKSLGINFNLAPVMDVNCNENNPVIGVRSYSDDPDMVAKYAITMSKGMEEEGVLSCAKHFPGHGDTSVDSHLQLPTVNKSLDELKQMELIPFIKAADNNVSAIMTAHILFPALENEKIPATMSENILSGLLREQLNYQGIIISDCMQMEAINSFYGIDTGVEKGFQAGLDIALISHDFNLAAKANNHIMKLIEEDKISFSLFNEKYNRIIQAKNRLFNKQKEYAFNEEYDKDVIREMLRETFALGSFEYEYDVSNALFVGCDSFRTSIASNADEIIFSFANTLAKHFNGTGIVVSSNPTREEIEHVIDACPEKSMIVVGSCNAHQYEGAKKMLKAIEEYCNQNNMPFMLIALRNPYDLKLVGDNVTKLCVWEYTNKSLEVITEMLEGKFTPSGKLPVKL